MTLEQAREVQDYMWDECNAEVDIREEYSGRGMYGKTCVALVTDDVMAVGYACGALGIPFDDVPGRTDSMGRQTVVY